MRQRVGKGEMKKVRQVPDPFNAVAIFVLFPDCQSYSTWKIKKHWKAPDYFALVIQDGHCDQGLLSISAKCCLSCVSPHEMLQSLVCKPRADPEYRKRGMPHQLKISLYFNLSQNYIWLLSTSSWLCCLRRGGGGGEGLRAWDLVGPLDPPLMNKSK